MNPPYRIIQMASGDLSLSISQAVSWEDFPACANAFLQQTGGLVTRKTENAAERVWEVLIQGQQFLLSYDDYMGMSLDATSSLCNDIILKLQRPSYAA